MPESEEQNNIAEAEKLMSRQILNPQNMKKQLFILTVFSIALFSCKNNNDVESIVTVKLNPSFITLNEGTNEPMNVKSNGLIKMNSVVSATDSVVYAIQVYENDAPYYYGLFNDVSKMQLALTTSKTYKFKVSAYKVGTGKWLKSVIDTAGTNYFLPTKTPLKNKFIKGDILKDIDLASSAILNNQTKIYPEVDAFYATKSLTLDKGTTSIDFTLLRMGFGVNFTVDALTSGAMEIYVGNDTLKLNSTKTSAYTVRQFSTALNSFGNIYSNATTFGDSIAVSAKWTSGSGTTVTATGKYKFLRNYQKTINIQLNTTTNTFNFEGWGISTVTDIDGNIYKTVTIGTQIWMAENLKVTHYRDGSSIPNITSTTWGSLTSGAWCDYSNSTTNGSIYGHLYNWYAATDSKNIAPIGWHVPSATELNALENYLIANGFNFDGTTSGNKIAKSLASTVYWMTDTSTGSVANDVSKNNKSGFNGLPSGYRYPSNGLSYGLGSVFVCWSSNNTYNLSISADKNMSVSYIDGLVPSNGYKQYGFAIRCIKD
jgi:uncharacterized protein (TIGR02145 family)